MLSGPGYPIQDKLENALVTNLSTETPDATLEYAREVSRLKGIDRILKNYSVDVIVGLAESSMTDHASASGSWELWPCLFAVSTNVSSGYPIASLPLGYLDFNGRPFDMAALAPEYQGATLIQMQSAWEAAFPSRRPPPRESFLDWPEIEDTRLLVGVLDFIERFPSCHGQS